MQPASPFIHECGVFRAVCKGYGEDILAAKVFLLFPGAQTTPRLRGSAYLKLRTQPGRRAGRDSYGYTC